MNEHIEQSMEREEVVAAASSGIKIHSSGGWKASHHPGIVKKQIPANNFRSEEPPRPMTYRAVSKNLLDQELTPVITTIEGAFYNQNTKKGGDLHIHACNLKGVSQATGLPYSIPTIGFVRTKNINDPHRCDVRSF